MARNYTSINHCALSSDTLAEANDATQALFWRLLCVSDDWGRFPNNPVKLKRMMQDFNHTDKQIAEAVKHFIDHESVSVYDVEGVSICEWNKWDDYQTMRWKNEAELPNREGKFEASTNPLSDRPSKKNPIQSKHSISYHNKADDNASVPTKAVTKAKHKTGHKPEPSAKASEFVKELFPDMELSQRKAGALILDEIEKHDKMLLDDLMPALRWARNNVIAVTNKKEWSGWSKNFKSCASLRKRKNGPADDRKWKKIYDQYKDHELIPPPRKKSQSELTRDDPEYWKDADAEY